MQCVNKNLREYQTLKHESGLSDFVLSAYAGDSLDRLGRFPYLDELPNADSSKAISEDLSLNKDNVTKTENILQATNTNTVEEAVPVLNNKYRDKEIEILEVGSKSKVYIITRPNVTQNQDGETDKQIKIATEMADIKEQALANGTFMLAPNGRQTHLTEQQWLQVRTQEFKDWFGDWENDPKNASKVVDENGEPKVIYHGISRKLNNNSFKSEFIFASDNDIIGAGYAFQRKGFSIGIDYALSNFAGEDINSFRNHIENHIKELEKEIELGEDMPFYQEGDLDAKKNLIKELKKAKQEIKNRDIFKEFKFNVFDIFQNVKNPLTVDAKGKYWHSIEFEGTTNNTDEIAKIAKNRGYDGLIIMNVIDKGAEVSKNGEYADIANDYIAFKPNQIKSATDNNGQFSFSNDNINDDYENVNSFAFFNEIIDKLQTLYGIDIIPITNAELSQDRWASITGTKGVKAFIYDGNIYINTDIATVDSPVHEFLHLLFGSMKYQNRELYDQLIEQAQHLSSYKSISENYPDRTVGDINEEVFVTELARYLTGQSNAFNDLPEALKSEIMYNINRTLDTVLMGENSVKCVENPYIMNLKTLAKLVNSSTMISEKRGSLSDAMLNRMMANTKSELMKNKELREECQ